MFLALGIVVVVYVAVSTFVVMTLSLQPMDANQGHVLSEAGAAAMGRVGFVVIGVAALLATASGVNATMFGDANLAYMVAKSGELPSDFTRGVWRGGTVGLLVAAVLTALLVVFFPLSAVGSMASLAFLIVYGTVVARASLEPEQIAVVRRRRTLGLSLSTTVPPVLQTAIPPQARGPGRGGHLFPTGGSRPRPRERASAAAAQHPLSASRPR